MMAELKMEFKVAFHGFNANQTNVKSLIYLTFSSDCIGKCMVVAVFYMVNHETWLYIRMRHFQNTNTASLLDCILPLICLV